MKLTTRKNYYNDNRKYLQYVRAIDMFSIQTYYPSLNSWTVRIHFRLERVLPLHGSPVMKTETHLLKVWWRVHNDTPFPERTFVTYVINPLPAAILYNTVCFLAEKKCAQIVANLEHK